MLLFPGLQVGDLDPIVTVARALPAHVHDDTVADELLDRDLVRAVASREEVDGGVEVGASVLGGAELISGVEVAFRRVGVLEGHTVPQPDSGGGRVHRELRYLAPPNSDAAPGYGNVDRLTQPRGESMKCILCAASDRPGVLVEAQSQRGMKPLSVTRWLWSSISTLTLFPRIPAAVRTTQYLGPTNHLRCELTCTGGAHGHPSDSATLRARSFAVSGFTGYSAASDAARYTP